jgi:hypothetical protein
MRNPHPPQSALPGPSERRQHIADDSSCQTQALHEFNGAILMTMWLSLARCIVRKIIRLQCIKSPLRFATGTDSLHSRSIAPRVFETAHRGMVLPGLPPAPTGPGKAIKNQTDSLSRRPRILRAKFASAETARAITACEFHFGEDSKSRSREANARSKIIARPQSSSRAPTGNRKKCLA